MLRRRSLTRRSAPGGEDAGEEGEGRFPAPISAAVAERVAIAALLVLIPAYLQRPALLQPPGQDQAIYLALGEGLLRGELPYRDLWDHKPPGIYLAAALAALAPGPSWPAFWALSIGSVGGAGLVMWRVIGPLAALLTVVVMSLLASPGNPEAVAALPAAVAVVSARAGHGLAGGVGAAVAVLISPQFLAMIPAVAILLGRRARILRAAAAGTTVGMLTLAWLVAAGILPAAFDALVVYNRAYLQLDRFRDLGAAAYALLTVFLPVTLLALSGIRPLERTSVAATSWLVSATALIALQGRFFAHYLAPMGMPLGVLLHRAGRAHQLFAVALIVGLRLIPAPSGGPDPREPTQQVGEWLRSRGQPGDTLLVWGVEVNTYLVSGMEPAHRFMYLMPLVTPGYTTQASVQSWVAELRTDAPTYLVDAEVAHPHWAAGADFLRPPPPGVAGGRDLDLLEPFRDFVAARYEPVAEVAGRRIYRLAPQPGGSGGG